MTLIESIILGIVQGLTEFLPVSSSAHLLMFPWLMGWSEPPFVFDTSLHIGTLVALFIYFKTDIINLIRGFFKVVRTKDLNADLNGKLSIYVLLGSLPAGLIGVLFEKKIEKYLHSPYVMVVTLIVWGVLLWLIDRMSKKKKALTDITMFDALFIGLSQTLALVPGTSRSGVTMTAALFTNFNRETAARFSFLLSIPITTAAALYKLKDLFKITMTPEIIINFLSGIAASGIVGYLCIAYLLKFLRTNSFGVFAIYRIIIGIVLAFTIPSLLQNKIELEKVNACSETKKHTIEPDQENRIVVSAGEVVYLQPKIFNKTEEEINDLNLIISVETSDAIFEKRNFDFALQPNFSYPEDEILCTDDEDRSNFFKLEVSKNVQTGEKIPVKFEVVNKKSGKRVDFIQELYVK